MANGDVCVAFDSNIDGFLEHRRAKEANNGIQISFVVPDEGSLIWFDLLAIPKDAPHVVNAHRLINYLMEPKVIADITNYLGIANANSAAMAEGHAALGFYLANGALDLKQARDELERARALAPGSAHILGISGLMAIMTGRVDAGLRDLRHAVELDPLNALSYHVLGFGAYLAHRYEEAHAANAEAISLDPDLERAYEYIGLTDYQLGKFEAARATCEARPNYWGTQWCLALTYEKLGRHADAQAALEKLRAAQGDGAAYQYATIYAQWGDTAKALEWLESAIRLRDPGFSYIKRDPLMDPLRKEPRYQTIERALNFPDSKPALGSAFLIIGGFRFVCIVATATNGVLRSENQRRLPLVPRYVTNEQNRDIRQRNVQ